MGGASAPAVPASGSTDDEDEDDEERVVFGKTVVKRTEYTWAGRIGSFFSVSMFLLFLYLFVTKVIGRRVVEANAKAVVAQDQARAAEEHARMAQAQASLAESQAEREAMQRQLAQARLKLHQAQVEPHFLFNTLAAVDYLIETDPPKASVMQKALIAYLRAVLPQLRQESSDLGREMDIARAYLELLKLRIEERLEFDVQLPSGLATAVFPPMVLPTLVENAIKHGIEPKPEGGKVTVRAEIVDGKLRVDVSDTGVGLPEGHIFGQTSTSGTGLGLENIRSRLAMLYPGTSMLMLSSQPGGGTLARVEIPYTVLTSAERAAAAPMPTSASPTATEAPAPAARPSAATGDEMAPKSDT